MMIKSILLFSSLQLILFSVVAQTIATEAVVTKAAVAGTIKNNTVTDYLQRAAARAKQQHIKPNDLIDESSPYLLQHAYNPVRWHAWGETAFAKARKEKKPIFLSIGYSTCHWCHVMAHESFENKEIAALLNKYFICIKVDLEQRPDFDSVYMSATQLINGSGGWPMTVFLDNKLRPFHAATYYPPFSSDNRTGLKEILLKIHDLWLNQPELIDQVATNVTARITAHADDTAEAEALVSNINEQALRYITALYDDESGGFSAAPKFPRPGIFAFLNQLALSESAVKGQVSKTLEKRNIAKTMMKTTLDAMAAGGIYDQVAGGFHRYSVDAQWLVPHFEKMLYSQALMVAAYSDLYRVDPQPGYKQVVFETLDFVMQEMRSPAGGFYSALDADSERPDASGEHVAGDYATGEPAAGEHVVRERAEGAYYLWSEAELKQLLPQAEFSFIKKYFQIKEDGNIFSDPQDEFTGLNIFSIAEDFRNRPLSQQQKKWLQSSKTILNIKRSLRPRPHLDDKIITAWNGMMISSLARASQVFQHADFLVQAKQTADFIKVQLYDRDSGKLYRQYRKQKNAAGANTEATLSDYAWLIHGLLDIFSASNEKQWLQWAFELQKKQDELFLDKSSAAYFESIATDTSILFRSKTIYDGAIPSANAIALSNLRQLSGLAEQTSMEKALSQQADKLLNSFAKAINENPVAAATVLAIEMQ